MFAASRANQLRQGLRTASLNQKKKKKKFHVGFGCPSGNISYVASPSSVAAASSPGLAWQKYCCDNPRVWLLSACTALLLWAGFGDGSVLLVPVHLACFFPVP